MQRTLALGVLIALNALACTKKSTPMTGKQPARLGEQKLDGENSPNASEVKINGFTYNGSGCPTGTVSSNISPDARALTVLFQEFQAAAGVGTAATDARRNCQVALDIQAPAGYSYTLVKVDVRGFANLEEGVNGTVSSTIYFQGQQLADTYTQTLNGPQGDNYTATLQGNFVDQVYSSCSGASRALNINTDVFVDNHGNDALSGAMSVDSVDGEFTQIYAIKWEACDPTTTAPPTTQPATTEPPVTTQPVVTLPPPPAPDASKTLTFSIPIHELAARHADCHGPYNKALDLVCRAAVRRVCAEKGYAGGMLVEYDSVDNAQIACLNGEYKTPALSTLSALHAQCAGMYGPVFTLACDSAATAFCGANYAAAFIQEYDGSRNAAGVLCVSRDGADTVAPSIGTLAAYHPVCNGPWNVDSSPIACNAAYSRYCSARGYKTGFVSNYDSANASSGACLK